MNSPRTPSTTSALSLILALAAGGSSVATPLVAQPGPPDRSTRELPAATQRPAESEAADRAGRPPALPRPPSKQQLLDLVRKQPGGGDSAAAALAGKAGEALPATAQAPAELAERGKHGKPPALSAPPSRQQLLELVRKQPGGQEAVDAAMAQRRRTGAALDPGGDADRGWLATVAAWLNPFHAEPAEAQSRFSCVIVPPSFDDAPCHLQLYGASEWGYGPFMYSYTVERIPGSLNRPYAFLYFDAPTTGWYYVSFETSPGAISYLKHAEGGDLKLLAVFGATAGGTASQPVLRYLTAGRHYFYFVVAGSAYFRRVTVLGF